MTTQEKPILIARVFFYMLINPNNRVYDLLNNSWQGHFWYEGIVDQNRSNARVLQCFANKRVFGFIRPPPIATVNK